MNWRVAFRADASPVLGGGHVMRCLALAQILARAGAECLFLMRDPAPAWVDRVRGAGHDLIALEAGDDAEASLKALGPGTDWLVVDHYGLDAAWEGRMRAAARCILALDDLGRRHDCDLLLDQNLSAVGAYAGLLPRHAIALLGPRYALLRPEFVAARAGLGPRQGSVRRVLVCFGAGDAGGETLKALEALSLLGLGDSLEIDVVIAGQHPRRAEVEAACRALPGARLHVDSTTVPQLMAAADVALGAGGVMALERCCLGLPSVVAAIAENQIEPARRLAEAGVQLYLGRAEEVDAARWGDGLAALLALPELAQAQSRAALALVDGRGAERVARHLLPEAVTLRRADPADAEALLTWRNHPEVRARSFSTEPITAEAHAAWFARTLANPDRDLLVAEAQDGPVGVLRYDLEEGGEVAQVSIYLVPGRAGQGWGPQILRAGSRWLALHRPRTARLSAAIRPDNQASLRAFEEAGYRPDHLVYVRELHE